MRKISMLMVLVMVVLISVCGVYAQDDGSKMVVLINPAFWSSSSMVKKSPVAKEIIDRLGLNIANDIENIGSVVDFDGKSIRSLVFVKGKFNTEKFIDEFKRENIGFEPKTKDGISIYIQKSGNLSGRIYMSSNLIAFVPDKYGCTKIKKNPFKIFKKLSTLKTQDILNLNLKITNKAKEFVKNVLLNKKGSPIVTSAIDNISGISLKLNTGELLMRVKFNDENVANTMKSAFDFSIGLARMMIESVKKTAIGRMKKVSVFGIFDKDIVVPTIQVVLFRKIMEKLSIANEDKSVVLRLEIPKKYMLPEFLIPTVVITGVIAPNFYRARAQAKMKVCISNMRTIEGAMELYFMEHGTKTLPPSVET